MADYYELLGVSRSATGDEIKRAYRQKARELHPDANPDDAADAERFKEVARAYEVLSDPDQRARYDRFGEAGVGGAGGGRPRGRVPGRRAQRPVRRVLRRPEPVRRRRVRRGPAGPPRGQDLEVVADITFEQAVFGATVPVVAEAARSAATTATAAAPARAPSPSRARSATAPARCSASARACSARWSPAGRARAAAASARSS